MQINFILVVWTWVGTPIFKVHILLLFDVLFNKRTQNPSRVETRIYSNHSTRFYSNHFFLFFLFFFSERSQNPNSVNTWLCWNAHFPFISWVLRWTQTPNNCPYSKRTTSNTTSMGMCPGKTLEQEVIALLRARTSNLKTSRSITPRQNE